MAYGYVAVPYATQAVPSPLGVAAVTGIRVCDSGRSSLPTSSISHSRCVPGFPFVPRILASVGMARIAAGADCACRRAKTGGLVVLGPGFREDLESWCMAVSNGLNAQGGTLLAPVTLFLERPAKRTLCSDA